MSFRREKFIPKGGPNGGNGGDGGNVIIVGDSSEATLLSLTRHPHRRATNGQPGLGKSCYGPKGDDRLVPVPLGTLVHDHETGEVLADITEHDQQYIAAKGGKGGLGNEHFKNSTNQTPRETTLGEPWEERKLRLELKLIADVGFVGMPNAGKSTMLASFSRATPKVADYPFTTLSPNLGIAELQGERRLVIADIPGLIEGAAEGAGLGHEFLRHIERTNLIVHLVDVMPIDGSDPAENYRVIREELRQYSTALAEKAEIIVLNKMDLVSEDEREALIERIAGKLGLAKGKRPLVTSGVTKLGVIEMLETCWSQLDRTQVNLGWVGQVEPRST